MPRKECIKQPSDTLANDCLLHVYEELGRMEKTHLFSNQQTLNSQRTIFKTYRGETL